MQKTKSRLESKTIRGSIQTAIGALTSIIPVISGYLGYADLSDPVIQIITGIGAVISFFGGFKSYKGRINATHRIAR